MILTVENLACARGPVRVVEGITFALNPGEALFLRGPNGAGKTTLLRAIAGLAPPVAGRVIAPDESIAFAGHSDGVKAQLSVGENLRFWAQVFRQGDIAPAVAHFDLAGLLDRRAGDLSAGQKRRLSLARLMVTGRKIWCLDEPTVSLDDTNTKRFAAMVSHHLLGGGVAIMATHINLGLPEMRVLNIADYAAKHQITDDPFAGVF